MTKPFGAVDGKIASNDLIHNYNYNNDNVFTNAHIVSGPTTHNHPPFCWNENGKDLWNAFFSFQLFLLFLFSLILILIVNVNCDKYFFRDQPYFFHK